MGPSSGSVPSASDLDEFIKVVQTFSHDSHDTLFGGRSGHDGGPDGDLAAVPQLFERARSMGLVACPASGPDDGDFGVWGASSTTLGPSFSLRTLATVAESCAGLAAMVHAQGIGRIAVGEASTTAGSVDGSVAAAFVPQVGTVLDDRNMDDMITVSPRRSVSTTDNHHEQDVGADQSPSGDVDKGGFLRGRSPFVWASDRPDHLAVLCRRDREPMVVAVAADADGVSMTLVTGRVGLRALHQYEIVFDDVSLDTGSVLAIGDEAMSLAARISALDWLGVAAIGLGTARAALREATSYASTRIQGGVAIIEHAGVRMLLAQASHDIATLSALIGAVPDRPLTAIDDDVLVKHALSARLGLADHAFRATSNCIQVLGGYGYMDDYGISKRLRDVSALRARHGSREQLFLALTSTSGSFPGALTTDDPGSGAR